MNCKQATICCAAALALVLWADRAASAQNPNYVLTATNATSVAPGEANVSILLDNLGGFIEAWSFSVCHDDTLITPTAVELGADVSTATARYVEDAWPFLSSKLLAEEVALVPGRPRLFTGDGVTDARIGPRETHRRVPVYVERQVVRWAMVVVLAVLIFDGFTIDSRVRRGEARLEIDGGHAAAHEGSRQCRHCSRTDLRAVRTSVVQRLDDRSSGSRCQANGASAPVS